jgi:hypothetical protein
MISKLEAEVAKWQTDSSLTTIHYIAVTAQGAPGRENVSHAEWILSKSIRSKLGQNHKALVFLDIQVGHDTVKKKKS